MKLQKSLPYFKILLKTKSSKRKSALKSFPSYVLDDLIEILFNVVKGNCNITQRQLKTLKRYKTPLLQLANSKSKGKRRQIIQQGGILPALIPILTAVGSSIAGGLATKAIDKMIN